MKRNYSEIIDIAESLVEELRECEDGEVTTTRDLANDYGYDDIDESNLFGLHSMIFKLARANHIILDMSAHKGMQEGLPYNLDFVVHNQKAKIKCPRCGSTNTARYLYGYPSFSDKLQEKLDSGKLVLGGCCLDIVDIDGKRIQADPLRKCNKCKKDFDKPSILYTSKKNLFEDYRDIVTDVKFSIGGFLAGYTDIRISKNESGAIVKVQKMFDLENSVEPKQISTNEWRKIVDTLFGKMYLHEWKKSYVNPYVSDGIQWSLDIQLTNKRKRSYSGSNDYPPYWNDLLKIFKKYTKIKVQK